MPSSTSNSDRTVRRAIVALLVACALLCVAVEVSTFFLMKRFSLTQVRIDSELPKVTQLRQRQPDSVSMLIIGNSLLVHGLQTEVLASDLGSSYVTAPLLIESTSYYDWFYGLRKIFHGQSRPDVVVVGLSVNNLLESRVRGEYFTQTLLNRRDLLKVSADVHASHTEASSMFFGTLSRFWGDRSVIRNRVLSAALPNIRILIGTLTRHPRVTISDAQATEALRPRLNALKQLCDENGSRLVLLLPPVAERDDNAAAAINLGHELGVPVLHPISPDSLQPSDLFDGVHGRITALEIPVTRRGLWHRGRPEIIKRKTLLFVGPILASKLNFP
jgi:hypothetical protein